MLDPTDGAEEQFANRAAERGESLPALHEAHVLMKQCMIIQGYEMLC
jgi:hypothetical protein